MSRRNKILLYGAIAFVICVVLILLTAYSQGVDPLHPRSRHIWLLSLVAAFYASFRGAMIFDRMSRKWSGSPGSDDPGKPGLLGAFRKEHAIDQRMAERKARVAAAKAKAEAEKSANAPDSAD